MEHKAPLFSHPKTSTAPRSWQARRRSIPSRHARNGTAYSPQKMSSSRLCRRTNLPGLPSSNPHSMLSPKRPSLSGHSTSSPNSPPGLPHPTTTASSFMATPRMLSPGPQDRARPRLLRMPFLLPSCCRNHHCRSQKHPTWPRVLGFSKHTARRGSSALRN